MKIAYRVILVTSVLPSMLIFVKAGGTPPVETTPVPSTTLMNVTGGFPWALILIFLAAGFIITAIKKNNPNHVMVNTCVPLINEKKETIEQDKEDE
ncbi:hypothetical protein [Leptolinea tardivitalis]|uniref:Uncharacterized protein n=1 Tax=Leptolinea tardivitalis TaxID=229920 RepID=A0A0P6X0T7_9CHLR|nr:hypothetical protein [Leptolinea tardivitalis]KPL72881.1 hypothetical protein ADM99_07480 [Leptolinea tardivitalis]GAP20737.1 hypothetical protein LTAR_00932 [Leptolinea tardivitalis]